MSVIVTSNFIYLPIMDIVTALSNQEVYFYNLLFSDVWKTLHDKSL